MSFLFCFYFPALQSSETPLEHVPVYGNASGSVRSTSPNVQTTLAQPMLSVQQSQTTAFVQPTQQQSLPPAEPASQEPATAAAVMMEAAPSTSQMERPSTSTTVFGTGEHQRGGLGLLIMIFFGLDGHFD